MQQQAVEYIKNATITGNVTNDPRMGEGGWVSFTIAHTPRHLNQDTGAWEDGDPIFHAVAVDSSRNGRFTQNVIDTIHKGDRVTVTGDKKISPWASDSKYGLNRVIYAQDIAASLKFATAQIIPNPKKTYDIETVQPSPYQG
jgi:single-stranded DNA-binding protein